MVNKGRKEGTESNGKSKGGIRFRYMDSERLCDFSVDNDDPNVTDGLRLIANALAGRNISVAPAPKRLKNAGNGSTEVLEKEEEETLEQTLPFTDPEPVDALEEEEETETPGTEAPKSKRKPKTPKVPTDINLSTATLPLADFMQQKNPTEMLDKYVVVAVWYRNQFKITDITIDRIWVLLSISVGSHSCPRMWRNRYRISPIENSGCREPKLLELTNSSGLAKMRSTRWEPLRRREH
jgi:hypothetical protein